MAEVYFHVAIVPLGHLCGIQGLEFQQSVRQLYKCSLSHVGTSPYRRTPEKMGEFPRTTVPVAECLRSIRADHFHLAPLVDLLRNSVDWVVYGQQDHLLDAGRPTSCHLAHDRDLYQRLSLEEVVKMV